MKIAETIYNFSTFLQLVLPVWDVAGLAMNISLLMREAEVSF